jgi:hypothetical protein
MRDLPPIAREARTASVVFDHLVNHDLFRAALIEARKKGGFACKMHFDGRVELLCALGQYHAGSYDRYTKLVQEKGMRVIATRAYSSRESRNPSKDQWGGAVRGTDSIRSFSGLGEELDELFSVLWGLEERDMDPVVAAKVLSSNSQFHRYQMAPHGLWK